MEVEEHIVEEYYRRKGYMTASNIRLEANREIDILAYKRPNEFLHIEVSIRIGYPFRLSDKAHQFDIHRYPEKKFNDPRIKSYVENFFGAKDYRKIIVIWEKPTKDWEKIKTIALNKGIEIKFLKKVLNELLKDLKRDNKNQRDEIIRTLQLVSRIGRRQVAREK